MSRPDYVWAEQMANDVLEKYQVNDAPVPVERLAKDMNLGLYFARFPNDDVAGLLSLEDEPKIVVNVAHAPSRKAFTIAHELGHFVLHQKELSDNPDIAVLYRRPIARETDPVEKEANCFAANLLVPENLLARYHDWNQPTWRIAKIFGVSEDVMTYRLRNTGRI